MNELLDLQSRYRHLARAVFFPTVLLGLVVGCAQSEAPHATQIPLVVAPAVDLAEDVSLNCLDLINVLSGDYDQFEIWDGKQKRDGIASFIRKGNSASFSLSTTHSHRKEFFEADVTEFHGTCAIEWIRPSDRQVDGRDGEYNRLIEIRPNGDLILGGDREGEENRPVLKLRRRR